MAKYYEKITCIGHRGGITTVQTGRRGLVEHHIKKYGMESRASLLTVQAYPFKANEKIVRIDTCKEALSQVIDATQYKRLFKLFKRSGADLEGVAEELEEISSRNLNCPKCNKATTYQYTSEGYEVYKCEPCGDNYEIEEE